MKRIIKSHFRRHLQNIRNWENRGHIRYMAQRHIDRWVTTGDSEELERGVKMLEAQL